MSRLLPRVIAVAQAACQPESDVPAPVPGFDRLTTADIIRYLRWMQRRAGIIPG